MEQEEVFQVDFDSQPFTRELDKMLNKIEQGIPKAIRAAAQAVEKLSQRMSHALQFLTKTTQETYAMSGKLGQRLRNLGFKLDVKPLQTYATAWTQLSHQIHSVNDNLHQYKKRRQDIIEISHTIQKGEVFTEDLRGWSPEERLIRLIQKLEETRELITQIHSSFHSIWRESDAVGILDRIREKIRAIGRALEELQKQQGGVANPMIQGYQQRSKDSKTVEEQMGEVVKNAVVAERNGNGSQTFLKQLAKQRVGAITAKKEIS